MTPKGWCSILPTYTSLPKSVHPTSDISVIFMLLHVFFPGRPMGYPEKKILKTLPWAVLDQHRWRWKQRCSSSPLLIEFWAEPQTLPAGSGNQIPSV